MDFFAQEKEKRIREEAARYEQYVQVKKALEKLSEKELRAFFTLVRRYFLDSDSNFVLGQIYGFITSYLVQDKFDLIESATLKSLVKQEEPQLMDAILTLLAGYHEQTYPPTKEELETLQHKEV